jgi:hypothetical protein
MPRRRRKSSYSISIAPDVDEITYDPPSMRSSSRRRSSYLPSMELSDDDDDEDLTTHGGYRMKNPWEKREQRLRESVKSFSSKSPLSHHECNLNYLLALLLLILRISLFLKFSLYNESFYSLIL